MAYVELVGDCVTETFVLPLQAGRVRWTEETQSLERLGGINLTKALLSECYPGVRLGGSELPDPRQCEPYVPADPARACAYYSQVFELDGASGLTTRVIQRRLTYGRPEWSITAQLDRCQGSATDECVLFVEQEEYTARSRAEETEALLALVQARPISSLVLKTNQPQLVLGIARGMEQAKPAVLLTTLRALNGNSLHNHTWDAAVRHVLRELGDIPGWMRVGVEMWNEGCLWLHRGEGFLFWDMESPLGTQRLGGRGWSPGSMNVTCAGFLARVNEPGWPAADHLRESWIISRQAAALGNTGEKGEIVDLPEQLCQLLRQDAASLPRANAFGVAEFQLPIDDDWSFLKELKVDPDLVQSVVADGPRALRNRHCPFLRIGRLFEIEEKTIEQLLSLNHLLRDYASRRRVARPLSIAVFGPAGSGKSFTVSELTRSAALPLPPVFLSFNLTQFHSADDLEPALHAVQSAVLRGKLPVVFWDEFDAVANGSALGWIKSFLGPMQDGEFFVRGAAHPLGRAVFVFAGATASTFAAFRSRVDQESRDAKLSDFVSRIKAWLDVPQLPPSGTPAGRLQRAMLVHAVMQLHAPHVNVIDRDVIEFLVSDRFMNAREIERAVEASVLSDTNRFTRARLLFTADPEAAR